MLLEIGLVGKPNVGKSTFFNAITLASAEVADYPFTTISHNQGVGYVRQPCPCRELGVKCSPRNSICLDGVRLIPIGVVDVAGLVPGAHKGRGLGNQFLDSLRRAEVLIHVVDVSGSTDSEGVACEPGENDPLEDLRFLEEEIELWLDGILGRDWERLKRLSKVEKRGNDVLLAEKLAGVGGGLHVVREVLRETGLSDKKLFEWSDSDRLFFSRVFRRVTKPIVVAANMVDKPGAEKHVKRVLERVGDKGSVTCAVAELALRRAAEQGLIRYIPGDSGFKVLDRGRLSEEQLKGLERIKKILDRFGSTGVQKVVDTAVFDVLGKIVVYPVENENKYCDHDGRVLPDAFIMEKSSTARDLAYKIHTEIGEAFIHAIDAKTKQRVGEDYQLKMNDVIKIVTAAK